MSPKEPEPTTIEVVCGLVACLLFMAGVVCWSMKFAEFLVGWLR